MCNLGQDDRPSCRESNPGSTEYEAGLIRIQSQVIENKIRWEARLRCNVTYIYIYMLHC